MKVLIDINHPAHVHFFKNPAKDLISRGAEVLFTSRDKDVTLQLLSELEFKHIILSSSGTGGVFSLGKELVSRDLKLYRIVKKFKPNVMAAIGGTFIAHVGLLTRVPTLVFYDTENAHLQNWITYPFASKVYTPRCYTGWVPKRKHIKYKGYHELSYLSPAQFKPEQSTAIENGLAGEGKNFLIRIVSWVANHDIGEAGWSDELLEKVVDKLSAQGNVIISSERPLPEKYEKLAYKGSPSALHDVLAFCDMYIGESATLASESVVLGVPAIYVALTPRGYTTEQETRYQMCTNIHSIQWKTIESQLDRALSRPAEDVNLMHEKMLKDSIDVSGFVSDQIIFHAK